MRPNQASTMLSLLACSAVAATALSACSSGSKSGSSSGLEGKSVDFITSVSNSFSQCLTGGLTHGLSGTGAKVVTISANESASAEQQDVQDAIAAKPAAVALLGIASQLDISEIRALNAAKIPVVYLINQVPSGATPPASVSVNTSSLTATAVAALPSRLPGLTKIGYINAIPGVPTDTEFTTAMAAGVKALGRGYQLLGGVPGLFTETGVTNATQELLQKYPDVQVIFFEGDTGVAGAQRVLAAAHRTDVKIVVVGAYSQADYDAIAAGQWSYAMAEPMATIGEEAATDVKDLAAKRKGTNVTQPAVFVDKSNVKSAPVGCL